MTPSITPAITLPSLRSCLRSGMRSSVLSPSITPAIGVCSIPPYPPVRSKPSRAAPGSARAARIRSPLRWRSARDQTLRPLGAFPSRPAGTFAADQRHMRVDIQTCAGGRKGADYSQQPRNEKPLATIDDISPAVPRQGRGLSVPAIGAQANRYCGYSITGLSAASCNPLRFPTDRRCTDPRGNSVRSQRLASARSADSLCWGHIGKGMRAGALTSQPATSPILGKKPIRIPKVRGEGEIWRSFRKCIFSNSFADRFQNSGGSLCKHPLRLLTTDGVVAL
jgi:hypothetical protein